MYAISCINENPGIALYLILAQFTFTKWKYSSYSIKQCYWFPCLLLLHHYYTEEDWSGQKAYVAFLLPFHAETATVQLSLFPIFIRTMPDT